VIAVLFFRIHATQLEKEKIIKEKMANLKHQGNFNSGHYSLKSEGDKLNMNFQIIL